MAHILREKPGAVFEYDGDAKALYYRLTYAPVARTVDIGGRVMVDVDSAGEAVGIEVLNPPGFTMTVSTDTVSRTAPGCSCGTPVPCTWHLAPTTSHQGTADFIAKGHLGTPCPRPRDGGMCGCDEGDDGPQDCKRARCDC